MPVAARSKASKQMGHAVLVPASSSGDGWNGEGDGGTVGGVGALRGLRGGWGAQSAALAAAVRAWWPAARRRMRCQE